MKKARYIIPIILLIIFITSCTKCDDCGYQPPLTTTITVGALLSLTGSGASSGQSSQVSIGFAQQDINTWLSSINKNVRISITYADTKTDTAEALTQLKIFYDKGIRLVIGPYSSAEVAAIKPFADLHGIPVSYTHLTLPTKRIV